MTENKTKAIIHRDEIRVGDRITVSQTYMVDKARTETVGGERVCIVEYKRLDGKPAQDVIDSFDTVEREYPPLELPDDALVITWMVDGRRYYAAKREDGEWIDSENDPIGDSEDDVIECITDNFSYDGKYEPGSFEVLKSKPKLAAGGYIGVGPKVRDAFSGPTWPIVNPFPVLQANVIP